MKHVQTNNELNEHKTSQKNDAPQRAENDSVN